MNRPKTTQTVINEFSKLLDSQDEKGFEKYNKSVDDAVLDEDGQPYDWKLMALEETADLQKYLVKQIKQQEQEIATLKKEIEYWQLKTIELVKSINKKGLVPLIDQQRI